MPHNSSNKFLTALNSIRYLTFLLTISLQPPSLSNTSHISKQTPYNSQLTRIPQNSLTNSLQLSTQRYLTFLLTTPYNSPIYRIPHISPNKLLTTLNSIEYLRILLTNSLQLSTQSNTLSFLLTFSLQLNQLNQNTLN